MSTNLKTQMRKGIIEICVLGLLEQNKLYPGDILQKLRKEKIQIPEGTLYPILTRLKNAKHVTYEWVESTGGPPRKYFTITITGKRLLKALIVSWKEINSSVEKIVCSSNAKK